MFQQFRHEVGLQPSWPAPSEHVAAFIAFLSLKGMAPSTITSYILAVAFFSQVEGMGRSLPKFYSTETQRRLPQAESTVGH